VGNPGPLARHRPRPRLQQNRIGVGWIELLRLLRGLDRGNHLTLMQSDCTADVMHKRMVGGNLSPGTRVLERLLEVTHVGAHQRA
jgi:hypothetical protein